jgi:O-antigen/teichoic acid export membrane protein
VRVAQLLILAQLFVPLYQIGDPILIGKGAFHLWVRRGLLLACLNLGLSVLFVAVFNMGIVGVALGTLISCLVELPLYAQVILRETQVSVRTWLATSGVGYLLLPVVAVIAFAAVSFPMLSRGILGVGVAAALAVGVYWVVAYAVVLTPAEREALWKRLGRRSAASSAGGA